MAADKTIPLQAVSNALMCAVIRLKSRRPDGSRHGRFAAYTQVPFWEPTCRDAERARRLGTTLRRARPQTFSPIERGELYALLSRVRLEHGLPEVRRTWGAGMRELQREFSNGVMR